MLVFFFCHAFRSLLSNLSTEKGPKTFALLLCCFRAALAPYETGRTKSTHKAASISILNIIKLTLHSLTAVMPCF